MVQEVIFKMIGYFKEDARRIGHALKVYGFACAIAGQEGMSCGEARTLQLAAVLHDIGIREAERKFNSTAGKYQEMEGPPIAEKILAECGVEDEVAGRTCFLVGNHHSYTKIDGLDFQILVEADFIVNIQEDGMDKDIVKSIRDKYFKTSAGKNILDSMYLSAAV
ncbi:hypothetical protein DFR58_101261 [Anaerobacterium chartisolvens]|uniref:HD domain-containing protein n=1 Tax=Anaerobacterium chartisolvens TaxID=1297424 RepID=A0A369BI13_9FIRM|nr:HD domain-containing protein [Anaerobacterium chartisolvens]RCX21051.1 hypothetical protein DFR58_101261 [Anaerobacterium chartisolvens]